MSLVFHAPMLAGQSYTFDRAQNSYATASGTISMLADGPYGSCAQFSASKAWYNMGLKKRCKQLSISFWVKPSYSDGEWSDIIATNTAEERYGGQASLRLEFNGHAYYWFNNGHLTNNGGIFAFASNNIPAGTWGKVTLTIDIQGTVARLRTYVGSTLMSSLNYNTGVPIRFAGGLVLGDTATTVSLADVRVYDYILSNYQMAELDKRPVARYSFDTSGTSISPNVIDIWSGLNTRASYMYVGKPPARRGTAGWNFTAANSHYVALPAGLKVPAPITVALWANATSWSSFTGQLISCTEGGGWGLGYGANVAGHGFEVNVGGTYYGIDLAFNSLSAGWHHFAVTFDGRYIKGYVDGVLKATKDIGSVGTIKYHDSNSPMLGAEPGASNTATGNYFDGYLDDVRIYASVLTEADIEKLYHNCVTLDSTCKLHDVYIDATKTISALPTNSAVARLKNISELGRKCRYIRVYCNGSTANAYYHLQHLSVTTVDGVSIPIVLPYGNTGRVKKTIVYGSCNESSTDCSNDIIFDLGAEYIIATCTMARYYADGRKYYQQRVQGSADYANWFDIYYSGNSGTNAAPDETNLYAEHSAGETWALPAVEALVTREGTLVVPHFSE